MADQEHDDLLTPEEIAAMEAEEGAEIDGSASLTGEDSQEWIESGWGAEKGGEETPESGEGDDTLAAAQQDEAAQQQPAPEPAAQETQQQQEQQPAPQVDMSDFDTAISEKEQAAKDLLSQYDDGDLSREEYEEKAAALKAEETELIENRAIAKQQRAQDEQQWNSAVSSYFNDYSGLKADKVISAFDAEVRAVTSNPALAEKSYKEQLAIAHKRLVASAEDMGLEGVPSIKSAEPKEEPAKQQQKRDVRGDELHTPAKTLAQMPAAEITDDGDNQYASLQRYMDDENVSPDDKEAALARLSPEDRDRFSSMNV